MGLLDDVGADTVKELIPVLQAEMKATRDSVTENLREVQQTFNNAVNIVDQSVSRLALAFETLVKKMDGAGIQFNWGDTK